MRLLLATSNRHKLEEVGAILRQADAAGFGPLGPIELLSLRDLGLEDLEEPLEDAETFEGNAAIKAGYYARAARRAGHDLTCIADDSGLVVDALGGAPGVHSARYAGVDGDRATRDLANNRLLLQRLADTPAEERTARFVCAMACATASDEEPASHQLVQGPFRGTVRGTVRGAFRGTVEGRIISPEEASDPTRPEKGRGIHGFGYDPLFLPEGLSGADAGLTSAEISPQRKNAISHRAAATRQLVAWLSER